MKNTLAVIAGLAVMGLTANAQVGSINANNYTSGGTITTTGGGLLAASATTWVEVLAGPAGGSLASIGVGNLTEAGYFDLSGLTISTVAGGASADFVVRAWTGAATYDAASVRGATATFTQTTGSYTATTPPGPVSGPELNVPTFAVGAAVVPEPTTIALAMLGAAAFLARRRK